jgi:hypothetical protein
MYIIYCLKNESFKDDILSIGITKSISDLKQIVADINKGYLPTPYTIVLTKHVYNNNLHRIVCSLIRKFGKHISGSFFEISLDIVKQLFDLIHDEPVYINIGNDVIDTNDVNYANDVINNDVNANTNDNYDIYTPVNLQEEYIVVQNNIKYIIPKETEYEYDKIIYNIPSISDIVTDLDFYYDKLSIFKSPSSINEIDL